MALRNPSALFSSLPSRLLTLNTFTASQHCTRCLHKKVDRAAIPSPTPFVPDVPTFLSLIGRQMSKHSSKIESWEDLFTMSSEQLREAGIEPTQHRRYLLRWREKFRRGEYGIGGDLKHVVDGAAELRVVQVPGDTKAAGKTTEQGQGQQKVTATITSDPMVRNRIVNLLPGETTPKDPNNIPPKPTGFKLYDGNKVKGPYLKPIAGTHGTAGRFERQEGMWEDKLGRKIDGGERRQAEVRAKKKSEERKKAAV